MLLVTCQQHKKRGLFKPQDERLRGKLALSYLDAEEERIQHLWQWTKSGPVISLDWCHLQRQSAVSSGSFQLKLCGPDLGIQCWDYHHSGLGKQGSLPEIQCNFCNKINLIAFSSSLFAALPGRDTQDTIKFSFLASHVLMIIVLPVRRVSWLP